MFVGGGCNEIFHSFATVGYRHPVMRGRYCGSLTTTDCFVKTTLQSASHMLQIMIKLCLTKGITCLVHSKSYKRWVRDNVPVPTERSAWPVAVTTCTLGAAVLNFWICASLEN